MPHGKPGCPACQGFGGVMTAQGWRKYGCTVPTKRQSAILRSANARDGQPFRNLGELVTEHENTKRG